MIIDFGNQLWTPLLRLRGYVLRSIGFTINQIYKVHLVNCPKQLVAKIINFVGV